MSPLTLNPWLPFVGQFLRIAAQGIIEGSRLAGVNHETIALTIAKTVLAFTGGGNTAAAAGTTPATAAAVKPPV